MSSASGDATGDAPLVLRSLADYEHAVARYAQLIDRGIRELTRQAVRLADAEREYRLEKAKVWLRVRVEADGESPRPTAAELAARVDAACADARFERDRADALRGAALEAVRSRRTETSAVQSLLAARREEAGFGRTGPNLEP